MSVSKKDYYWNTVGVLLQNALSPLLLVVVTRLNGIEASGLFSFAFSVAIIFWAISLWGGRTYQVSDVKGEFTTRGYILTRLLLGIATLVLAITFVLVNGYSADKSLIIITLVLQKITESIADSLYGALQINKQLFRSGISLFYKSLGGFVGFLLVNMLTHNLLLSCLMWLGISLFMLVFYDYRYAARVENFQLQSMFAGRFYLEPIRIIKKCFPIFIITFLAMFSLNIPRYFIDVYHPDQIGYFGIIAMPITLVLLIMGFLLQPKLKDLADLYGQKKYNTFSREVRRIAGMTALVGIFVIVATILAGARVLEILFSIAFGPIQLALVIIVVGAAANALVAMYINILVVMRRIRSQAYVLLFTNICLVIASAVYIPHIGLEGSATLFTLTNLLQLSFFIFLYTYNLQKAANAKAD